MLSHLTVSARLRLGFGLLLGLLCIIVGLGMYQMRQLADVATYYATNLVPSYEAQQKLGLQLSDIRRFEMRHLLSHSEAEMADMEQRIAERRKSIDENLERYAKELLSDDEDKRDLDQVRTAIAAYYAEWEKVRPLSRGALKDPAVLAEATKALIGPSAEAYESAHKAVAAWWTYNVKLAHDEEAQASGVYTNARHALLGLATLALALGAFAAFALTRSILRQLGGEPAYTASVANESAQGNLAVEVKLRSGDSTSLLATIKGMRDSLSSIVSNVRNSSDSIATSSAQIAAGNADLSQRTEEQASNLQQTAASMEQLSGTVKTSAESAGQANQLAESASAAATHGGEMVGGVVATMQEIAASSKPRRCR